MHSIAWPVIHHIFNIHTGINLPPKYCRCGPPPPFEPDRQTLTFFLMASLQWGHQIFMASLARALTMGFLQAEAKTRSRSWLLPSVTDMCVSVCVYEGGWMALCMRAFLLTLLSEVIYLTEAVSLSTVDLAQKKKRPAACWEHCHCLLASKRENHHSWMWFICIAIYLCLSDSLENNRLSLREQNICWCSSVLCQCGTDGYASSCLTCVARIFVNDGELASISMLMESLGQCIGLSIQTNSTTKHISLLCALEQRHAGIEKRLPKLYPQSWKHVIVQNVVVCLTVHTRGNEYASWIQ